MEDVWFVIAYTISNKKDIFQRNIFFLASSGKMKHFYRTGIRCAVQPMGGHLSEGIDILFEFGPL